MSLIPRDGSIISPEGGAVMIETQEILTEKQVTYTIQYNGRISVIENVPARVDEETGEEFFSPATVEKLQQIVLSGQSPDYFTEVAVYKYVA
jgi:YgiT-type zinc finger domain-containing protein